MADRHFHQSAHRPALSPKRLSRPLALLLFISALGPAQAERALPVYKSLGELPQPVTGAFKPVTDNCEWHISQLMVLAFGSDVIWKIRCPSNHANQFYAYVIARDALGTGATLLLFPTPRQGRLVGPLDNISNAELNSGTREITHSFTNPEEPPCRVQAAWRIEGVKPVLVFWREARRCKGDNWSVKLNERKSR